jgi:hypothetical protein
VGDIKPLEMQLQQFFDMAYDFGAFTYDNVNAYQPAFLARLFGKNAERPAQSDGTLDPSRAFTYILDTYYRLAWNRKPEYMGYEIEWDSTYTHLYDGNFSFETGTAQKRLADYEAICFAYDAIEREVAEELRPALFEMLGYAVHSAYQMNRKFLYAQRNHETGNSVYAEMSRDACRQIERLRERYNTLLDGKWNQMMSAVPPGYTALYHKMPEYVEAPTDAYRLPDFWRYPELPNKIDLATLNVEAPFRLLQGIGTDWVALQMGEAIGMKSEEVKNEKVNIPIPTSQGASSITLCLSVIPVWPVSTDCSNRFAVSVDGGERVVCENTFKEWGQAWKKQVLENRKEFQVTLPLDTTRQDHILTLSIIDPGQMIQKITFE